MMLQANWGSFTRQGNEKVAQTLINLLTEGFIMPKESYDFMEMVAQMSGVSEVTDTDARDLVMGRMEDIMDGKMPMMRRDFHKEDEDEDEYY